MRISRELDEGRKEETKKATHLLLCFEVGVVLGHVLRWPLLDQTATQQPDGQTSHKHADVRYKDSDAVPCVCPDHAEDKNKKNRLKEGRHLFLEYKHPITIESEVGLVSWDRRRMENRIEGKKCLNFARVLI